MILMAAIFSENIGFSWISFLSKLFHSNVFIYFFFSLWFFFFLIFFLFHFSLIFFTNIQLHIARVRDITSQIFYGVSAPNRAFKCVRTARNRLSRLFPTTSIKNELDFLFVRLFLMCANFGW